jgi:hypothetical protein
MLKFDENLSKDKNRKKERKHCSTCSSSSFVRSPMLSSSQQMCGGKAKVDVVK